MAQSCCCGEGKTVLLYACSGGANVGEAADRACRQLTYEGCGQMFCLAGLGGDIQGMIQTAKDADLNVIVDGCDMDCGKKTFDRCGVTNYVQVKVTDLGIEKAKPKAATDEEVAKVVAKIKEVVASV
ncbi:MAG: putative zinc-binding protein [Alphaproteobacteria bacterium]